MITPTFKVEQDHSSILVTIHTPHVRAQDVDLFVEGSEFRFYLKPYFLRLHLPGNVLEDDAAKAEYDPSNGQFCIRVTKETPGETFADLDLLTKLLARKGESDQAKKALIEVIGEERSELAEADDFHWELPQTLPPPPVLGIDAYYGFNDQYTGYFRHVQETANEINELESPETPLSHEQRREVRVQGENARMDEDYYCSDYVDDGEIQQLMAFKTNYAKELKRRQKQHETPLGFSPQEEELMRQLPRKEYLLQNEKTIYLGLVDLLFAYSYNYRMTEGEGNVESCWCIGKLCSTFSTLEVKQVIDRSILTPPPLSLFSNLPY
ncbi:SHQ1 protein-domain-containing protein [Sporodiniella umbellata]|nr:SHQ1 protein-domain-containing protein [Sporodiniella umbellata]